MGGYKKTQESMTKDSFGLFSTHIQTPLPVRLKDDTIFDIFNTKGNAR